MAGTPQIKAQWHVCFILALLYMIANIDGFIINLMVEPMKRDLVLSDTQVSLLVGITFSLFYVLFGLPIARLADRANRRNILAAGIGVWSLMTAKSGSADKRYGLERAFRMPANRADPTANAKNNRSIKATVSLPISVLPSAQAGVANSNEKMMVRRGLLLAPFRI